MFDPESPLPLSPEDADAQAAADYYAEPEAAAEVTDIGRHKGEDGDYCPVPETVEDVENMGLWKKYERIALAGVGRRLQVDKERLQYKADHDPLTGALTREAFQRKIEEDQQANPGASRGLMFIDLGNFKAVNALLGHQGGDEILKSVVALFQRVSDVVCRFGGDEFAIYIDTSIDSQPSTNPAFTKRTLSAAEKLAAQVERVVAMRETVVANHPELNEGDIRFYVAAGGVVYNPNTIYEVNLAAADTLSEESKDRQAETYGKFREADLSPRDTSQPDDDPLPE